MNKKEREQYRWGRNIERMRGVKKEMGEETKKERENERRKRKRWERRRRKKERMD